MKKRKAWNRGRPWSQEVKDKISLAKRGKASRPAGFHLSEETKRKLSLSHRGKVSWCRGLSAKTDDRLKRAGEKIRRENNGRWRGGCRKYYQNVAFKVWEEKRGAFPKGKILHHVDGDYKNNAIGNLVAITWSEHEKIHQRNPNRNKKGKYRAKGNGCSAKDSE